MEDHADEVELRCFNGRVETSRLIYKHADLFYLFAHIRIK